MSLSPQLNRSTQLKTMRLTTLRRHQLGNVALSDVVVQDSNVDTDSLACDVDMPFVLQPGEQVECSAVRTVLPADIIITAITNQASVSSMDPAGSEVLAVSTRW